MLRDPVKLRNVEEEIERVRTQLARALELQAALELRAGVGGQLVMPRQADMEGVFVRRGTLLGQAGPTLLLEEALPEKIVRAGIPGVWG